MTIDVVSKLGRHFEVAALDASGASIAVVNDRGVIVWVNAAWRAFGEANGAEAAAISLGVSYFDAALGDLRQWVVDAATRCLASGEVLEHDYECSSPIQRREFRMRLLRVPDVGLLFEHSLRYHAAQSDAGAEPALENYREADAAIVMCSNCRRVRRRDGATWDWVPAWVRAYPAGVSHGLCPVCLGFYYT